MASHNVSMSVTFNDNDGSVGWRANPDTASDVVRHIRIFGLWRARWIFLKRFWRAMRWVERYSQIERLDDIVKWRFRPEIPE